MDPEQQRQVLRGMLPVRIQGDDGTGPLLQGLFESPPKAGRLAQPLRIAQQTDGQIGHCVRTVIAGAIVNDNDADTVGEHPHNDLTQSGGLIQRGYDHVYVALLRVMVGRSQSIPPLIPMT
jgi:hypothetical protein